VLSYADIDGLVSPIDAMESQKQAFTALATGTAQLGPRVLVPGPDASTGFSYVARLDTGADLVAKVGSVNPANARRRMPTVSALVTVLDAATGRPTAVLDGEAVTNLRTVAASAVVAAELRPAPETLAVIGLGVQGRLHAEVLSAVLRPQRTIVYDPHVGRQEVAQLRVTGPVSAARKPRHAVETATVVVTCTTSTEPVLRRDWLLDDALVLSIGSFAPDRSEVGADVVNEAAVVVDDVPTALEQAGPVRSATAGGTLRVDQITAVGDLLTGRRSVDPDGLTYYNSVGLGIQDAAVVPLLVAAAARAGVGVRLPW
jgi:ornithine cyclodeaminase